MRLAEFKSFSVQQKRLLTFWKNENFDGVIADGAVRSGKTVCGIVSFVLWAFSAFSEKSFAICGKSVSAVRRNVINEALSKGDPLGKCEAFCKVLKENGVAYGVYASESEFKTRLRGLSADIPCWIAHYGVKRQELPCYMWQSSSDGKIDGVTGRCDTDVLYGEYIPYQNPREKPTTEFSSETKYKLGQRVRFSTCYKSSTDDISKAISAKNMLKDNGVITKIYAGRKNPYLLDGDLCFVNDGDIREVLSSPSLAKDSLRNTQFYIVQRGDNLTKIARLFGVRVKELVRLNDIKNPDLIFPGQRLKIR